MQEMMTPEQVADYLQLATDAVYRLIRQKKLAAAQIGRAYRVPREDLERFLVAHSTRPAVREALFRRFMAIGERHPQADCDRLLEDLEQEDEADRANAKRV